MRVCLSILTIYVCVCVCVYVCVCVCVIVYVALLGLFELAQLDYLKTFFSFLKDLLLFFHFSKFPLHPGSQNRSSDKMV